MARYSVRRNVPAVTALLASCALVAAGIGPAYAGQAGSGDPAATAAGARTTVVFVLRPRQPAALRRLAIERLATAADRAATLRRAAPPSSARDAVTRWLSAHGFAVAATTPWTVTATADAGVAAARLDVTATTAGGHPSHVGTLRTPPELAGAVRGVVGLDDRPVFRHATVLPRPDGTLGSEELHQVYDADPAARGTGATVATVQFSGWNHWDLGNYATGAGLTDANPAALTPYSDTTQRPAAYDSTTDGDGDFEVALDQESLLATAPDAAQRIYFAKNTLAGFELALSSLLTDVQAGKPVTALSVSWGACEQDLTATGDASQVQVVEQSLADLTAAGVTIFAASGDSAGYDCAQSLADGSDNPAAGQAGVDFPGSSPYVVSVGGTRLSHTTTGWHETAWGPRWATGGRHEGSGGGFSRLFSRPGWQAGIGGQFGATGRGVPDIASAADPDYGFGVYEKRLCGVTRWCTGGGTSAGAPAQAGLFASALAATGHAGGIGDVHPVLYGNPGSFRDIDTGSNGDYSAGVGWDDVTGLGTPQWDLLRPQLLAAALVAPRAVRTTAVPVFASAPVGQTVTGWASGELPAGDCTAATGLVAPTGVTLAAGADRATGVWSAAATAGGDCVVRTAHVLLDTTPPTTGVTLKRYGVTTNRVSLGWNVTADGVAPSWGGRFQLRIRRYRDQSVVWSAWRARGGGQVITLAEGAAYRLEARATDRAGNVGTWAHTGWLLVPYDNRHFGYGSHWRYVASTHAYGGHIATTATKGAATTVRFRGSKLWLLAFTTPGSGTAWISIDGHYVRTVDLYTRSYLWQHRVFAWQGSTGLHTLKITATGRRRAASSGANLWIDAIDAQ